MAEETKNCCCSQRRKVRERTEEEALLQRLSRIEGQVRGVRGMVENSAYCTDILTQVSAIQSALNAFNRELLARHIRTCVVTDIQKGDLDVVDDLVATIQKMMKGREILKELERVSGETSETYAYQSAKIKNSALNKGIRFYETAIHKFLGNSVIKRLENIRFRSDEEIRQRLVPDTSIGKGEWVDVSGLIAPKSEIERVMSEIETGTLCTVKQMHERFAEMHACYYTYEWTWAYEKMLDFYHLEADKVTARDIVAIVRQWQESVVWLDRMVYEDAQKEFSLTSMTGFGADGSKTEQQLDFEQVRGVFESNPFVTAVLEHIKVKTALGNELIDRLKGLLNENEA